MLAEAVHRQLASGTATETEADIDQLVHDLRGPLSVIVAFAETLDGAPREERARYAERLVCNAHRALALLAEFSALHDLRQGGIEVHRQAVDLGDLCRAAVEIVRQDARDGSDVSCLVAEGGVVLSGDRDLLGMALRAVLRRSLREMTSTAALRLRVACERGHALVDLSISDSSAAPEMDPDARSDLEILQRVVSLHGGRVLFDHATPDLIFRVALPVGNPPDGFS